VSALPLHFRFTQQSRHQLPPLRGPLRANSGHSRTVGVREITRGGLPAGLSHIIAFLRCSEKFAQAGPDDVGRQVGAVGEIITNCNACIPVSLRKSITHRFRT
jgi:hypothetical protein